MPALISRYSGVCRYLANSACHSASESGGRAPVTGRHSVIDSPDSVSRVTPPITTMAKIIAQQARSQSATGLVATAGPTWFAKERWFTRQVPMVIDGTGKICCERSRLGCGTGRQMSTCRDRQLVPLTEGVDELIH